MTTQNVVLHPNDDEIIQLVVHTIYNISCHNSVFKRTYKTVLVRAAKFFWKPLIYLYIKWLAISCKPFLKRINITQYSETYSTVESTFKNVTKIIETSQTNKLSFNIIEKILYIFAKAFICIPKNEHGRKTIL